MIETISIYELYDRYENMNLSSRSLNKHHEAYDTFVKLLLWNLSLNETKILLFLKIVFFSLSCDWLQFEKLEYGFFCKLKLDTCKQSHTNVLRPGFYVFLAFFIFMSLKVFKNIWNIVL